MLKPVEPPRNLALFGALLTANLLSWLWAAAASHGHPALLGTALLAWVLGLRHAVDADHIAAIDNVVRKLMRAGTRPDAVGFWFSLGHSTVVVLACLAVSAASVTVPGLLGVAQNLGSVAGTLISATFLMTIAAANFVALRDVWLALRRARRNPAHNSPGLDVALGGGLLTRILRPALRMITQSWQMYPLGFLFGLGFDTATEIAILGISASGASLGMSPWQAMVFPALFTSGMALIDTTDSALMVRAYGWAFTDPSRKLWYNLAVTALSVTVALSVGGIEVLGLLADRLSWRGWAWLSGSVDNIGFIVIALFAALWLCSFLLYAKGKHPFLKKRRFDASPGDELSGRAESEQGAAGPLCPTEFTPVY
jgi:high-affinity nickel-transport protein